MADGAGSRSHYLALPTGSRLYEFEIEGLLGHGGFGITYRATDTLLQETVAIKEYMPSDLAIRISDASVRAKSPKEQPDFDAGLKSFLEEARVMARFRHSRIVHVRRFFELHGTGYIVLDYESGQTLSERLSEGPIADFEIRDILAGVLDGLEVIHARAILHRDMKPHNVMLREDGSPVIIDFGAARDFQARHSRSVTAIATAGYAPPEQYGAGGQQGPWSDLYALGAIGYRAVSGAPPVDSLRRLRKDPLVPAVVAGAGKYSEELLRTIDWMLKIDEEERPVSVAQVREALRGGPIPAARTEIVHHLPDREPPLDARPQRRRGKVAAIAAGLVVLAGLGAVAYDYYASNRDRQQAAEQAELRARQQTAEQAELRAKLEAELIAKQQAQQDAARQQLLAAQLEAAGTDPSKLEQFLTACGSTCPDALRNKAQAQLESAKQQQRQTELARQDEATYRAARGDLNRLRAYDTGCTVCAFRPAAKSEIASMEQQAAAQIANDCDRLAAAPNDQQVPAGVAGVGFNSIDTTRAIAACRKAADTYPNEPRFPAQLGRAFHAAKNYDEAARFYKIAVDRGNGPATSNLGKLYYDGTGVGKDRAEAVRLFRKASDQDVPAATTNLAKMYMDGDGVSKDEAEALRLYQKGADLNIPEAMSNLGSMYLRGVGTSKDYSRALPLLRRAAGLGDGAAMFYLGTMYQNGFGVTKDGGEAAHFYRNAIDLGIPEAMSSLGGMYLFGADTPKDYPQALPLLRRAADLGNAAAMHYLGFAYQNGLGVTKDGMEATRFYRKAVDLGIPEAMSSLGAMYLLGQGAPKDYSQALTLFRRATDLGNANAMANLGYMYANGIGVPKNMTEGVRLYQKASDLGDVVGMSNLAVLYINGLGVTKNRDEGIRLLRKAAGLGYEVAKNNLKTLGLK